MLKEAARRRLGGGNFSGTQRGRGGALTPRGRSWAGVPLQDFLEELLLCPNDLWSRPLSDPLPVPEGSPDVARRSLSGHGGSGGGGAEGGVRGLKWFSAEGLFPDLLGWTPAMVRLDLLPILTRCDPAEPQCPRRTPSGKPIQDLVLAE